MAESNYFRITSLEDNNVIALTKTGSPSAVSLQYRTDLNQTWQQYTIGTQLTLLKDSWIEFRNTTGKFSTGGSAYYKFTSTKKFNVSGKIGSLLYYALDQITAVVPYAFNNLFKECTSLVDASQLEMNVQTAASYCCSSMFYGCTSLTGAPELPAMTLETNCYSWMFQGCTSLTEAPALPATILAANCYRSMFYDCTSLAQAPELPATTLADSCYYYMFNGCKPLTEAPKLPATALATNCYRGIFAGCSKIDAIECSLASFNSTNTQNWLQNVSSTGTFYYTDRSLDVAAIPRNAHGIPAGWTIRYIGPMPPLVFSINGRAVSSLTINGKAVAKLGA